MTVWKQQLTATDQHHKTVSYHISLTQEKTKIQKSMVSTEWTLLFTIIKLKNCTLNHFKCRPPRMSYSVSFGKHFMRSVSYVFSSAFLAFSSHSFLVSFSRSFETQVFSKFPLRASLHLSYARLSSCVTSNETIPRLPPKIWWHQNPWLKPRSFFQILHLYSQLFNLIRPMNTWVATTTSLYSQLGSITIKSPPMIKTETLMPTVTPLLFTSSPYKIHLVLLILVPKCILNLSFLLCLHCQSNRVVHAVISSCCLTAISSYQASLYLIMPSLYLPPWD